MATTNHLSALVPTVRAEQLGLRHDVLGAAHLYKLLPEESNGSLAVWEAIIEPGIGAPPHRHANEEEAFYVIEGAVVVELGESAPTLLRAGGFFFAPRGVRHSFRNEGPERAKLLVMSSPGTGLFQMFGAIDAAARRNGGMAAIEETVSICADHGVTILPPA
jgi:quercetin dioxygenase-like cupin family protein